MNELAVAIVAVVADFALVCGIFYYIYDYSTRPHKRLKDLFKQKTN